MNVVTRGVVPAAAALLLLALGLTLDVSQLGRLVARPRPLLLGLVAGWLVVPAAAVVLCRLAHPAPATALGVLLLACCPLVLTGSLRSSRQLAREHAADADSPSPHVF